MLEEIDKRYADQEVSVHVVWLPMVDGDGEKAARRSGVMFGRRVHQYYDADRVVGVAYYQDVFRDCLRAALAAMPKDHPLYTELSEWAEYPPSEVPLWDAALFYPRGVEWLSKAPVPAAWSKQVAFRGAGPGASQTTGTFFRNDCAQPPVDSDWRREVRQAMTAVLSSAQPAAK